MISKSKTEIAVNFSQHLFKILIIFHNVSSVSLGRFLYSSVGVLGDQRYQKSPWIWNCMWL